MLKHAFHNLNLKVGDRVVLRNGDHDEVDVVDSHDKHMPYRLKKYGWYYINGSSICDLYIYNIIKKLSSSNSKSTTSKTISTSTVSFTLTLTKEEVELMRNCLSDLVECGQSLNLKLANALIDAGYRK